MPLSQYSLSPVACSMTISAPRRARASRMPFGQDYDAAVFRPSGSGVLLLAKSKHAPAPDLLENAAQLRLKDDRNRHGGADDDQPQDRP